MRRRIEVFMDAHKHLKFTSYFLLDTFFSRRPLLAMEIATKTQGHKVKQKVLLKINPWCLCAFVAKKIK